MSYPDSYHAGDPKTRTDQLADNEFRICFVRPCPSCAGTGRIMKHEYTAALCVGQGPAIGAVSLETDPCKKCVRGFQFESLSVHDFAMDLLVRAIRAIPVDPDLRALFMQTYRESLTETEKVMAKDPL